MLGAKMILGQFRLEKKQAIVTGAGKGIGQAVAVGLAEAGAELALVSLHSPDEGACHGRSEARREDHQYRIGAFISGWASSFILHSGEECGGRVDENLRE
jgi:NAD(P)-dependent dehydrogenase (short-subunit alcohol dehydrogenase family)